MNQVLTTYLNHYRVRFLESTGTGVICGIMVVTRGVRSRGCEADEADSLSIKRSLQRLELQIRCSLSSLADNLSLSNETIREGFIYNYHRSYLQKSVFYCLDIGLWFCRLSQSLHKSLTV